MELLKSAIGILVLSTLGITVPPTDIGTSSEKTFKGTTPCGQAIRPLLNIGADTDCALVKWELTFFSSPAKEPTGYRLTAVSHFIMPDNTYSQAGTKSESAGKWRILLDAGMHHGSEIFELDPGGDGPILRFVKLSEDVIHLLDDRNRYMTGDPFHSYTLYGISK